MTAPREILPGDVSMLTRRCTQRQYFLRPGKRTNAIFAYCLAEAAKRFDIGLIAWLAMSNHYHAIVHDPKGQLPAFTEHFHKMLAKALNIRWNRWENLWSTEETCMTHLATAQDVFDKVVYVLANPMAGHLVDSLAHWPGCNSMQHLGGARTVHRRPTEYFSPKGRMPEEVELGAIVPPGLETSEAAASWAARVREAVARKERELREERLREGIRIVGRKAVLATSAVASPSTSAPRRTLRPRVACKNPEDRIRALSRLLEFQEAYRIARLDFVSGNHTVVFPAGTYRLRAWGARCAPFPIAA